MQTNPNTATAAATTPTTMPRIGDKAPDFRAITTHGEIQFHDWAGDAWTMMVSHPADFTPVCSTELTEIARRNDDFAKRNVKVIGVSIDSIHSHLAWVENLAQILDTRLPFPLVADIDKAVSSRYGMIHPGESSTVTVRAVFFVDPKRVIRAIVYYPLNVGRNVDELLRVCDALQTADANAVACPVNWKKGDPVIVPPPKTVKEVEARKAMSGVERRDFYLVTKPL